MGWRGISGRIGLLRVVVTLCLVATLFLILLNSAQAGEESGGRSAAVTAFINGLLDRLGLSLSISHLLVRKLAHLLEYTLLGFLLLLELRLFSHRTAPLPGVAAPGGASDGRDG